MAHNGKPLYMQQICNQGGGFKNSPYMTTLLRDALSNYCDEKRVKHFTHSEAKLKELAGYPDLNAFKILRFLCQHRPDVQSWYDRIDEERRQNNVETVAEVLPASSSQTETLAISKDALVVIPSDMAIVIPSGIEVGISSGVEDVELNTENLDTSTVVVKHENIAEPHQDTESMAQTYNTSSTSVQVTVVDTRPHSMTPEQLKSLDAVTE